MGYYSDDFLRKLRNEIKINEVINALNLESKNCKELFRFRCPQCNRFHTATNPKTNLARCFECKLNFNPIDLVMAVQKCNFLDSVEFLKKQIKN